MAAERVSGGSCSTTGAVHVSALMHPANLPTQEHSSVLVPWESTLMRYQSPKMFDNKTPPSQRCIESGISILQKS